MSGVSMSFGLVSEIWNLNHIFGINILFGTIVVFLLFIVSTILITIKYPNFQFEKTDNQDEQIAYLSLILFCCIYSNFDYRLPIFILIFDLVLKTKNNLYVLSYILFMSTSVSYYLDYFNYSIFDNFEMMISSLLIIINIFVFHIFLSFTTVGFFKYLIKKDKIATK